MILLVMKLVRSLMKSLRTLFLKEHLSTVSNHFVSTIKQNTTESVKLLGDILEELKKVEAENAETNDRLKDSRRYRRF